MKLIIPLLILISWNFGYSEQALSIEGLERIRMNEIEIFESYEKRYTMTELLKDSS